MQNQRSTITGHHPSDPWGLDKHKSLHYPGLLTSRASWIFQRYITFRYINQSTVVLLALHHGSNGSLVFWFAGSPIQQP